MKLIRSEPNFDNQQMKMEMKRLHRISMALLTVFAATGASAATDLADGEYRYGQVSAGIFSRLHELDHTIDLSTGLFPVVMPGVSRLAHQRSWSVGLGRQWRGDKPDDGSEPRYWRVEAEYWGGMARRTQFESRMLKVPLADSVRVSGIHAVGLARVARGDSVRWWIGAGLGYVNVSIPDANAASASCGCLGPASGSGWSPRLKTLWEADVSENTTAYLELSLTKIPSVQTASGSVPVVRTSIESPMSIHLGLRRAF